MNTNIVFVVKVCNVRWNHICWRNASCNMESPWILALQATLCLRVVHQMGAKRVGWYCSLNHVTRIPTCLVRGVRQSRRTCTIVVSLFSTIRVVYASWWSMERSIRPKWLFVLLILREYTHVLQLLLNVVLTYLWCNRNCRNISMWFSFFNQRQWLHHHDLSLTVATYLSWWLRGGGAWKGCEVVENF